MTDSNSTNSGRTDWTEEDVLIASALKNVAVPLGAKLRILPAADSVSPSEVTEEGRHAVAISAPSKLRRLIAVVLATAASLIGLSFWILGPGTTTEISQSSLAETCRAIVADTVEMRRASVQGELSESVSPFHSDRDPSRGIEGSSGDWTRIVYDKLRISREMVSLKPVRHGKSSLGEFDLALVDVKGGRGNAPPGGWLVKFDLAGPTRNTQLADSNFQPIEESSGGLAMAAMQTEGDLFVLMIIGGQRELAAWIGPSRLAHHSDRTLSRDRFALFNRRVLKVQ
jgi:hypothetical protein